MKLIIPLAGKGTRLRPHTLTKPKPLLKVAGKTILDYLLDNVKDLKFSEVIFITGAQKDAIQNYVTSRYKFKATFVEQKIPDGSAGAIKLAKEFIDEDVLILFSDTLFDTDLSVVKVAQKNSSVDGLIWVKEREDYQRFGVVITDTQGFMTKIVEKPQEPISRLANIGMYYVKNYKLMFEGIEYLYKNNINLKNEYYLVDAFEYMIKNGAKIKISNVKGWYDCGRIDSLLETNQILLKKNHKIGSKTKNCVILDPVYLDKGVVIENSIIGPFVSIASGTVIKGSIIKNTIIDSNSVLENIKLRDSLIGESVTLKSHFKKLNIGDYSELHFY